MIKEQTGTCPSGPGYGFPPFPAAKIMHNLHTAKNGLKNVKFLYTHPACFQNAVSAEHFTCRQENAPCG